MRFSIRQNLPADVDEKTIMVLIDIIDADHDGVISVKALNRVSFGSYSLLYVEQDASFFVSLARRPHTLAVFLLLWQREAHKR